ncbi:hypothetical protein [Acinetobacter nectaris]|uniref:hypothetical protein n=1 Tax=Acinetobacter nectaris TaxID=1219382 RepID=UPI001F319ADA|nr:hypothetical protein [Acinetobacter nectaris]MCF9047422.1 hypothetical protein [Acinetobacter nectaris]
MKKFGICTVLLTTVLVQGCQIPQVLGQKDTVTKASELSKSFAMTPEQFRVAMNQKLRVDNLASLVTFSPFVLNNHFFTVDHIADQQIMLEGKVNSDGQLTLIRYRSHLMDEKSLVIAMSLIKNTAKILPSVLNEKDRESSIEQIMEDAVASPTGSAKKEIERGIIYSASSLPNGLFEVSYQVNL